MRLHRSAPVGEFQRFDGIDAIFFIRSTRRHVGDIFYSVICKPLAQCFCLLQRLILDLPKLKGSEMRSGRKNILVQEAAQAITTGAEPHAPPHSVDCDVCRLSSMV